MEETSGAELGWFFQQWLMRAGSPVVEGDWEYDVAAKKVRLTLAQTQAGEAYRLPLEIAVTVAGSAATLQRVEMLTKSQTFEIASEKVPASVELDPNAWVLMDSKFGPR
jgi:aminopeptidase N